MKKYFFPLILLLLCGAILDGQQKPLPPGRRELKDYQAKHADEPAPVSAPRLDPVKLQQEAAELADLAQSIPPDVDRVTKGALPKDLLDKLKHIEKISKRLRGEIAR
jgi:hypothetical protein